MIWVYLVELENILLEERIRKVSAIEGESPVFENNLSRWIVLPSRAEHEKFRLNPPGPPGKAKYSHMTDSVTVPWGKGEKYPWWGVK